MWLIVSCFSSVFFSSCLFLHVFLLLPFSSFIHLQFHVISPVEPYRAELGQITVYSLIYSFFHYSPSFLVSTFNSLYSSSLFFPSISLSLSLSFSLCSDFPRWFIFHLLKLKTSKIWNIDQQCPFSISSYTPCGKVLRKFYYFIFWSLLACVFCVYAVSKEWVWIWTPGPPSCKQWF